MQKDNFTIPECAERLQISRSSVYRLLREGKLSRVRIGGRVFIPRGDIQAILIPDGDQEKNKSLKAIHVYRGSGELDRPFAIEDIEGARRHLVNLVDAGDGYAFLSYERNITITYRETANSQNQWSKPI